MTDQPDKQPQRPAGVPEKSDNAAPQPPAEEKVNVTPAGSTEPPAAPHAVPQPPADEKPIAEPIADSAQPPAAPQAAPQPPADDKPITEPIADSAQSPADEKPIADSAQPPAAPPAAPQPPADDKPTTKPIADLLKAVQPAAAVSPPPAEEVKEPARQEAAAPETANKGPFTVPISDLPPETADAGTPDSETIRPATKVLEPPPPVPPAPSTGQSAPAASAAQICPNCNHRNRPGVFLCENCGTNLMTGRQPPVGTRDLVREPETTDHEGDKLLDTNQLRAVDSAGSSTFTENTVLRIEIEGATTPMLVFPKQEIILGRRDPNTGGMPDVDLTAYAGYRMGVSRRHASIRFQDRQLHVSDLGSSNGTFLNGTRLTAHRPYQLRDGDEIRLGQMMLRLFFQAGRP